jgi:PKD repeat protein
MIAIMRKHIKLFFSLLSLLILLTFSRSPAASALPPTDSESLPGQTVLIRLDPQVRQRYEPPPAAFLSSSEQAATATIVVNYNGPGWTLDAQTAFEFAVDIWESLITSPVPIVVDAEFGPLGPGVLGGAGPTTFRGNFSNAPQTNTWYPIATANKLATYDLSPGLSDIQATFSSSYADWYFGTDSSTPTDKISFVSVVLHELGHGLGFLGSMRVDGGIGIYGYSGYPMIYDRYTENGAGTALLAYSNNSTDLGDQLTSNNIFFDSPAANFANGGNRVPLYAPSTWNQGSSYSHLAESFNVTSHSLMTYSISRGETLHNPGSVTLCMFKEMGWTVAETCGSTAISGLTAGNDGPTALGSATQFTASITSGSNVTYEWDFGDSTNGNGLTVSHQYAAPGSYIAQVTASNSINQETATTTVQVEEAIAGLSAVNDGPTLLGTATQLTATISGGSNVTYNWDFGDSTNGSGASVPHQYAAPGSYIAEVTASNAVSQSTTTTTVQIDENITPISGLTAANDGPTIFGTFTQLTATITSGNNVTYEWDFGDGASDNGGIISHQYTAPGTYTAVVTATNSVGQASATTIVQVEETITGLAGDNDGPTILGTATQLTASISSGSNVAYEWDFGDGNSGSGPLVSHQYAAPGTYTAEVAATNLVSQNAAATVVMVQEISSRVFIPLLAKP